MAVLQTLTEISLSLVQLVIFTSLGYHYLLLFGGARREREHCQSSLQPSFAVVIPAHNEEAVIAKTVVSILGQNYPAHSFDVYVVADYCSDQTAGIAQAAGAITLERNQGPCGRKGFALKWGLDQILAGARTYDAIAIFDADSELDPGCLAAFAPFIAQGYPVLQGQKTIRNAQDTPFTSLDDVNYRLTDLLRGRAKTNLGFSARLMGDVMCFHADVIGRYGWPAESLVEDREFGLYLLLRKVKVTYVPGARSTGEAVQRWRDATAQRLRWVGGGQGIARAYTGQFLRALLREPRPALLDQLLELVLPPYTLSLALTFLLMLLMLIFPGVHPISSLSTLLLVFVLWVLFPLLGLLLASAPTKSYLALWLGPVYVIWRLAVSTQARLTKKDIVWVRTKRSQELQHDQQEAPEKL